MTDKKNIGRLKLVGTYDLHFYPIEAIKRVRLVRRADGYYCQFIISRQRQEFAKKVAYCVVQSRDLIAYEDLRIKNLVKNHCLAKSICDAAWYQFRLWLEYFGNKYGICACGCRLDRDENAARNILTLGLGTVGHSGTWLLDSRNAWGEDASTLAGVILLEQATS